MNQNNTGAFVIVVNNKQLLLGKRKNSYKAGMFGFPGGRLELNETIMECGARELLEETGLIVKSLKYVGVVRELQKDYNFVHFVLVCDDYEGSPKLLEPDKCESWEFYPVNNIPSNILPGHKAGIDILINNGINYRDLVI